MSATPEMSPLSALASASELGTGHGGLLQVLRGRDDPPGLVDAVVDELFVDAVLHPTASGWQEYLVRLAHGVRRTLLDHPSAWPAIVGRPTQATWLRAPLRTLRCLDSFLETLHRFGFTQEAGVAAYRSFCSFLLGHVSPEIFAAEIERGTTEQDVERRGVLVSMTAYPRLVAARQQLDVQRCTDEFEEALESLLDRITHDGAP